MANFIYPYQSEFESYIFEKKHYSPSVLSDARKSVSKFWTYFINNRENGNSISDVNETDVRAFLIFAKNEKHLAYGTVNKYLVYLRKYFTFLFEYQGISTLPTISIKQLKFNKVKTVIINIKPYLSDIISDPQLSNTTKKALVLASYGVQPRKFNHLHFDDIKSIINDTALTSWLKKHLNFSKMNNPLIFSRINGTSFKDNQMLKLALKKDQKYTPIKLGFTDLRNSYIYSIVSNLSLSDEQIFKLLNINLKTLTYYKNNLRIYKLIDYKDIHEKNQQTKKD